MSLQRAGLTFLTLVAAAGCTSARPSFGTLPGTQSSGGALGSGAGNLSTGGSTSGGSAPVGGGPNMSSSGGTASGGAPMTTSGGSGGVSGSGGAATSGSTGGTGGTSVKNCGSDTLCPDNNCYNLATDATHCLSCGTRCDLVANGSPKCTSSGCDAECGANLYCAKSCCPPPPHDQIATCVAGQCGNECAPGVLSLICANPVSGKPACGSWTFESMTDEGWKAVLTIGNNAANGDARVAPSPGPNGGNSLAIDVTANDDTRRNIRILGKVCPGGNVAQTTGLMWKADVWFQGPQAGLKGPGYVNLQNSSDNKSAGFSGDSSLYAAEWKTWSANATLTGSITDVEINASFGAWTGTVYFDNIRFEFPR